jgi:hypothetical protein
MILAIDLSLRSAGVVLLNEDGVVDDFMIVANKELQDEALIKKNCLNILDFCRGRNINKILIEGLSFASISSSKDIIAGNFWTLRVLLKDLFNYEFNIVPVTRWRKQVISKERVKELEAELGEIVIKKNKKGKEVKRIKMPGGWQKKECVRCLPIGVKEMFDKYIKEKKLKKDSIFDLTDAYFLGMYGWSSL